jgi:hypothetical protein
MNKEVKETIKILQNNSLVKSGSYEFIGDSDITYAEIYILLKFIEDLQQENKQLHEASLTIQEMTERDIECPSNCEKLRQLKKQLEDKEDYINKLQATKDKLDKWDYENTMQQKEFIRYLKEKEKQFDMIGDPINSGACCGILNKYKEIIGGKDV